MSPSVRQLNMRAYKALYGESVIPEGCYCYNNIRHGGYTETGFPIIKTDPCPYWDMDENKPSQMNGYCWFMERGDWEGGSGGLLWDQCKECGINDPDNDEDDAI